MIVSLIQTFFQIYLLMILVTIVASWFPNLYQYRWMRMIADLTRPYLNFFRRIIPPIGMLDLSPLLALICLEVLERILVGLFL